ncbi:uncharacterized protein ATNIH1004_011757 [Aspergillus tanneri]|nr:uncharacterized protein ATNIH1004_011757 [Aspergillus tanneri]KAA8641621.1 hypothetical protein ATNIH1004_011757 [Aspergillus tanneri]
MLSQRKHRAKQKEALGDLKDMIWSLAADIRDMKQEGDSRIKDLHKTLNQLQDTIQETQQMTTTLVNTVTQLQVTLEKVHQDIASDKRGTEDVWLGKGKAEISMARDTPRRAHPPHPPHPPALSVMPPYQNFRFNSYDPTLFTPISTPMSAQNHDPSNLGAPMTFLPNTKAVVKVDHPEGKAH